MTSTSRGATVGADAAPILLYDGSCGLCARSVQFVLQHEHGSHALRFATLQGEYGAEALRLNPATANIDSVVWLEPATAQRPSRVLVRSEAVLAVARHLGGVWGVLGAIGTIIPRFLRDAVYRMIAANRYRVFGRDQSCLLPTPEQRVRFLG